MKNNAMTEKMEDRQDQTTTTHFGAEDVTSIFMITGLLCWANWL
jgi:hypothetical protein